MDLDSIGWKLFEILSPVLLLGLTWLSARAAQLIAAKVKNEYLKGVLVRLDDAVVSAVRETQQVTVEALKAANADGRLTPEERAQAKQAALDSLKSHLGIKGLGELAKVLGLEGGAIEKVLSSRVEAAVHGLKEARAANGIEGSPGAALPFAG